MLELYNRFFFSFLFDMQRQLLNSAGTLVSFEQYDIMCHLTVGRPVQWQRSFITKPQCCNTRIMWLEIVLLVIFKPDVIWTASYVVLYVTSDMKIWTILFSFSQDESFMISRSSLKCGLIRRQSSFPPCVSPSVGSWLVFVGREMNCVYSQWLCSQAHVVTSITQSSLF